MEQTQTLLLFVSIDFNIITVPSGFSGGAVVTNLPTMYQTQEVWFDPWVQKDPLEEEMATHSSIPAWRTPWMEEPGGPQSTGVTKESDMTEAHTLNSFNSPV